MLLSPVCHRKPGCIAISSEALRTRFSVRRASGDRTNLCHLYPDRLRSRRNVAGDLGRQSELAMAVAVLTGLIGIIAWFFRLGNIANFVSETVLSGFKVGAGLVIASTQLPKLFGIATGGSNFFTRLLEIFQSFGESNLPTLAVGLGALLLLILGDRFLPGRPVSLFVVVAAILMMSFFPLAERGGEDRRRHSPRGCPS